MPRLSGVFSAPCFLFFVVVFLGLLAAGRAGARPAALGLTGAGGRPRPESTAPPAGGAHRFTFDDMMRLGRVSEPQISPDGTLLCFVLASADTQHNQMHSALWLAPLDGGPPRALTFPDSRQSDVRDHSPRFSPEGGRLAFISNRDGSAQAYLLDLHGGEARRLTNLPGGASGPVWTPDGRGLLVATHVYPDCPALPEGEACNRQRAEEKEHGPTIRARLIDRLFYRHWDTWFDGTRSHLLRVPVEGPGALDLTPGEQDAPAIARAGQGAYAVSPDGKELAVVQNRDREPALSTNSDIFLVPLSEGPRKPAARNLTEKNRASDTTPRYSPDGRFLAYLAQRRPGFESDQTVLWLHDRQGGGHRPLTAGLDASVEDLAWAPESGHIYFTTSLLGHGRIYRVGLDGKAPEEVIAAFAEGLQVTRDGRGLVFASSSLSRAAEVYRVALTREGKAAGPPQALTHVNDGAWPGVSLGQVGELWAQTGDGQRLHSYLITPAGFAPGHRYPAVVLIHGGPQGAWNDVWFYRWNPQVYAGAGYVVLMINPRGSEGFGQRFVDQVSGDWGGRAYDDVMRAVDGLVALPYVDPRRVAALGASYGGYMVDWLAGHTDRFAALVSHDGVYDLRSMMGETEELWFPRWEFLGHPWDSEQYDKWSPARFVQNVKTPMLIITNERDYRVPVGQGMQLFTALQIRGVPSRMLIFPDENHWVLKPGNARIWHAAVLDWLHRYLGGAPADEKALRLVAAHAR